MQHPRLAVLFDLDGVLVDTAELHYRSWFEIAKQFGVPFDRNRNDALRGLGRMESLQQLLGPRFEALEPYQRQALTDEKNDAYLRLVAGLSPADLLPGVSRLLTELRNLEIPLAVASSSKNARAVIERLGIADCFSALVDGNEAQRSKPDPQVFLIAAERLGVPPPACIVVEDAASGIAAALAAGMHVVGVGPPARVAQAHRIVPSLQDLSADELLRLADGGGPRHRHGTPRHL